MNIKLEEFKDVKRWGEVTAGTNGVTGVEL